MAMLSYRYLATGGGETVWSSSSHFLYLLQLVWLATSSVNGLTDTIRTTNSRVGALPR